jgi:Acetyltransferase (GNAT) family
MSVDQAAAALRPAQGDDAEALRAFVASLSREAIESRTHSAGVRLDPRALLCGETGRAYVATIDDVIAGVACYAPVDADGTAEFAIVITDRHQGRGLAACSPARSSRTLATMACSACSRSRSPTMAPCAAC